MEKKKNTGLKIFLAVLALVVAAAGAAGGWYWTSYQKASTAADAGLFAAAEPFLKLEKVTNLHDAEFGDYVRSGLLKDSGDYTAARDAFDALGEYRSSADMAQDCRYQIAANLFDGKDYEQAKADFEALGDYSDAAIRVLDCDYAMAEILMEDGKYDEAMEAFEAHPRIRCVTMDEGFLGNASFFKYARDLGHTRGDMYEVGLWEDAIVETGDDIMYAIHIPQESVTIPETMDAIRAATSLQTDRIEATNKTNEYLNIGNAKRFR